MSWLGFLKRRKPEAAEDELREALFDAVESGDASGLDKICQDNKDRIVEHFETWRKVPHERRSDAKAVKRYGEGLISVAEWFARNGAPQLREALRAQGAENPISRWEARFSEGDALKKQGRFTEAIAILEDLAVEMAEHKGSAVEKYLPMVQGLLGESFFRNGRLHDAYEVTRAAFDGCMRGGDIGGLIAYCGNLYEICRLRGAGDEARYWLVVTTNAMIQAGQAAQAANIRRQHGIEPTTGLIEAKGPLG